MQSHDAEYRESGEGWARTPEPAAMSVPLTEPTFGVVFDRPDAERTYAWGPFAAFDTAARFAEFVEAEIDPARVIPWADAQALPGVRVADPVAELLTWRTTVALSQHAASAEEFAAALLAVDPVEWALAGQHAGADAAKLIRRVAAAPSSGHSCGNCEGIDPDTCLANPDRPAAPTSKEPQR